MENSVALLYANCQLLAIEIKKAIPFIVVTQKSKINLTKEVEDLYH
jgi:hypothetical protein